MNLAIVIPAFNSATTIGETLSSLQNITSGWDSVSNVLVCDDASSDNTVQAVESAPFNRCRLTLLKHPNNKGEAACYQTMIQSFPQNVDWFLILHSDDLALDCFLDRNLRILSYCDSQVAAVSSNYYVLNGTTETLAHSPAEDRIVFRGGASDEITHTAAAGCWWHISGSLINKFLWQQFGGRDPSLPQVGDWDLMLRWQRAGYRVGHSLIPTTKYRTRQAASVSSRSYLEFRDLRERTRVITNSPDLFTPSITVKYTKQFGITSLRRICKLILNGEFSFAAKGLWTTCRCMVRLGRQSGFPALEALLALFFRCRMHRRWIAEFGLHGLFKRFTCRRHHRVSLDQVRSKRFGPFTVRQCAEDFAVLNTIIIFDAYHLSQHQYYRAVLDLGGNIGIATRYFLRRLPDVHVLAVEPSSANCEVFLDNVRLIGDEDRVRLLQCAVGAQDGIGVINTNPRFDSFTVTHISEGPSPEDREVVPIRSIKSLVKELPQPVLLKMDIEGTEGDLLDCRAEWVDKVSCMMIEFHDSTEEGKWVRTLTKEGWKPEKHFDTWHFVLDSPRG